MKLTWFVMIVVLGMYVAVCRAQEGFVSTGIQVNERMNVKDTLRKIDSLNVKHIIIIPYLGTNKLNLLVTQINAINSSSDKIYIMVVNETDKAFADDFFSNLCDAVLDVTQLVGLTRNDSESQRYSFSESTDMVLLHKINQVLQKINKE